jgi:hypothetical protein
VSAIATVAACLWLTRLLGLADAWRGAAAFLAMSLQMFYATTAHVANDWLAVPLFTAWLAAAVAVAQRPDWRRLTVCVAALSAGLLTKAYFLTAVPVTLVVLIAVARKLPRSGWRRWAAVCALCATLAGSWYWRNARLYHSVSGMQEVKGGVPLAKLIDAARRAPWRRTIDSTAHSMIWTGNNSDTSFNRRTVNVMLVLLAGGLIAFAARRRWSSGEAVAAGAVIAFVAALGYSTAIKVFSTEGVGIAPSAWFVTPLVVASFCLAASGLARMGKPGKGAAVAMLWIWTYVISATYWLKLIPMYAGYPVPQVRPRELWGWYAESGTAVGRMIDTTAMLGAPCVLSLGLVAVLWAIGVSVHSTRRIVRSPLTQKIQPFL